jgi:hypothetical protein
MALPWIIGGVAVVAGKMIYDAVTDNGSCSYSDREEREKEVKKRVEKEKREKLIKEIESYKKEQIALIQSKYNTKIDFISENEKNINIGILNQNIYGNPYKVRIINRPNKMKSMIISLKRELNDLKKSLRELEVIENEALRKDR